LSPVEFQINGKPAAVAIEDDASLLTVLRNALGLTGARFGCGEEQCGACMVLVDGAPAYSCTLPASAVAGKPIVTLEGLGTPDHPHPLQVAFIDEQAGQCGYCLAGILVSAKALIDRNPTPTRADIVAALDRHLCRCGAHNRIVRAVERAAAALRSRPS
jgi:nicotinate dehydrogenase subunit A